jgi:acetoacetyl-CoA reductase
MKRLALVTGGTRGIGAASAIALRDAGYEVVVNYAASDEIAQKFSHDQEIKSYKWDVSNFDACMDGVKRITDETGRHIEILVNNAGITRDRMMHKMDVKDWNEVINTNLNSCFNMSSAVIKPMRDTRFGRIINISSINAQSGQIGQTNYSAAKAGILGFTKALAKESADKNITVNAIAPGYVETEMTSKINREVLDNIINQVPVKRLGLPFEIARAILFLVHDDSGFITGETLAVNGGYNMV